MDELIQTSQAPTRDQIDELQRALSTLPQVEDMVTEHYFNGGLYCRKLWRKANTLIVGKVHKSEHLFMCAMGTIIVWNEDGKHILKAGDVMQGHIGTKRVTYALEDSIGIAIHKTDKIDVFEIEKELIEDDPSAMYDAENKLRLPAIEGMLSQEVIEGLMP